MLKFTEAHEWLKIEGDIATVGITEFAASELGDLVYIELPDVGSKFDANAEAATVESVKAASEVYAPLKGEIIEVNQTLEDEPGLVNEDAQGKSWLFKMKLDAVSDADALMDEAAYKSLIG